MLIGVSPLTVAWSMCAAACGMLALMQLVLWFKQRRTAIYLFSTLMALGAMLSAFTELSLMRILDAGAHATVMKLQNLAVYLLLIPMVWFIHTYFGTARRWLAVTITAMWSVAIVANFLSPHSLVFADAIEIKRLTAFWGEEFSIATGPANPWKFLADLASLLITIYIVDASVRAWRQGSRRHAAVIGGSMTFFILLGGIHSPLVDASLLPMPYIISFAFLAIVLAMTYELVNDAILASRYASEIAASEKRWRLLLENVPLLVAGVDREGRIDYTNPCFRNVSGYARDEVVGRHLTELLPESVRSEAREGFSAAMRGDLPPQVETALKTKAGALRQIAWSNVLITDPEGEPAGTLSIGSDLTEQLKAQNDLQETRREMERMGRAMVLGELGASLAHELNQPLAAILSNAQAARRLLASGTAGGDELRDILDDIVRDDTRAGDVISGLRDMVRKGRAEPGPLRLEAAISEVGRLLRSELGAAGVALEVEVARDLTLMSAGRVEIQQVVTNLVLNAIRAMRDVPAGRRKILIRADRIDHSVQVLVMDSGSGIDEAMLPSLFDAFFSTRKSGLGMGLTIARGIVETHGGRIWAQNNPGGGATFAFTLPVLEEEPVLLGTDA